MRHLSRQVVHRWVQSLLHTHDTPGRTAVAIGLGVAIGFSPFLGLHIALGMTLAFLFNLNRVAVMAGLWVNLPWLMAPYYAAATAFGTWLLGVPMPVDLVHRLEAAWRQPHWAVSIDVLARTLEPLLWPFTIGSLIGALLLGFAAYRLTLPILITRAARHHDERMAGSSDRGL